MTVAVHEAVLPCDKGDILIAHIASLMKLSRDNELCTVCLGVVYAAVNACHNGSALILLCIYSCGVILEFGSARYDNRAAGCSGKRSVRLGKFGVRILGISSLLRRFLSGCDVCTV